MIETLKPYPAAAKAYMMQITGIYNIERELDNLQDTAVSRPVLLNAWLATAAVSTAPAPQTKSPD